MAIKLAASYWLTVVEPKSLEKRVSAKKQAISRLGVGVKPIFMSKLGVSLTFLILGILALLNPRGSVLGFNFTSKIHLAAENEAAASTAKPSLLASISIPFLKQKLGNSASKGFGAGEETWDIATIGDDTILPNSSPLTTLSSLNQRKEIITYAIQAGDNPTTIAAVFGITLNSLLWANNLNYWSIIRPGDELTIPPVSGVIHTVQTGDAVSTIASGYKAKADDIIVFNDLPADGALQPGQILIIPDGEKPALRSQPQNTRAKTTITGFVNTGQSHPYPYGQCTWWVAQKRPIPLWGDAKNWLNRAEAAGYSVCRGRNCKPQTGAIISLRGTSWTAKRYGHVAYVEKVEGDEITFSEMNYVGWAKISTRMFKVGDWSILGYIY